MYQDAAPATITALVEPNATIPARLAPYVPPPQPTIIPGRNGQPGVVVMPNGESYYGFAPVTYAQPQALADPQAMARAVERIGQGVQMVGAGGLAAGAGFGINEVIGAVAGVGTGTLLLAAALIAVSKMKATRKVINHIKEEHHYDQNIVNVARGWFSHADGSINHENTKVFNNA